MIKTIWDFIPPLSDAAVLTITIILGITGIISIILIGKAIIKHLENTEDGI